MKVMSIKHGRMIRQMGIKHELRNTDMNMNAHVCNVILICMLLRMLVSAEVTVSSHKYLQNEMTCCIKQGLETNIPKERFECQIWWSDVQNWYKACTHIEAVGLC